MSDENIKIIKHIQQYGHPLQGDKMTDHNQYSPYCTGGYQPKSLPKDFKIVPPNTGSNIVGPKSEQYKKGTKVYEAYQQGKQDMAKELLSEFITIYAALKGTRLGLIKEPRPDIISEGALLFLQQQIEDLSQKYMVK